MAVITKKKNSNKRYRFNLITPKILGKSLKIRKIQFDDSMPDLISKLSHDDAIILTSIYSRGISNDKPIIFRDLSERDKKYLSNNGKKVYDNLANNKNKIRRYSRLINDRVIATEASILKVN